MNAAPSTKSNGSVGVLLGNGDGTFQPAVSYSSGGVDTFSVAVGDVNGDGKPDLVVANKDSSNFANTSVGVLLGNGDGTFQPAISASSPSTTSLACCGHSFALADFDGDGKLDIASGAGNFLMLGNGDGTFQAPIPLGVGGAGIAAGDFNHDGKPDLAVAGVNSSVTILRNMSQAQVHRHDHRHRPGFPRRIRTLG